MVSDYCMISTSHFFPPHPFLFPLSPPLYSFLSTPLPLPQAIFGLEELMKNADDLLLIAITGVLSVIQWTTVFLLTFIQVCFISDLL